jgi:hypothetical protein
MKARQKKRKKILQLSDFQVDAWSFYDHKVAKQVTTAMRAKNAYPSFFGLPSTIGIGNHPLWVWCF